MWSIIGHLLVSYRYPFGFRLSFIWFMFIFWGQFLTWFWFHFGPILVTNWAIIGPKLVNLWAYDYMIKTVSLNPSSWCGMFIWPCPEFWGHILFRLLFEWIFARNCISYCKNSFSAKFCRNSVCPSLFWRHGCILYFIWSVWTVKDGRVWSDGSTRISRLRGRPSDGWSAW